MILKHSTHGLRLRAIALAREKRNVAATCRELGISRSLFYRWRKRFEAYGLDGRTGQAIARTSSPRAPSRQAGEFASSPSSGRDILQDAVGAGM